MLYLNGIDYYIPEIKYSVKDLRHRYAMSDMELTVFNRVYGLDKVPVSDIPLRDMIYRSVKSLLEKTEIDLSEVKYLIHTHTAQEYEGFFNKTLKRLAAELGLHEAKCFGMTTNNCASTVSALDVIEKMLVSKTDNSSAILITGDVAFTPVLQVIPNSSITGDASVACLLSNHSRNGARMLSNSVSIYGEHAKCQWQEKEEMQRFEDFYPNRLSGVMQDALESSGLNWSNISVIVPHNVNVYSWKKTSSVSQVPYEKIYLDQVSNIAHCFGADPFLNLAIAMEDEKIEKGDQVMMATVGLGAVFGAAVFAF
ncbi:ketoacyl-ACP synthase III family protein [Marinicella sp. W31]|uniref:ketoacyl-ACP synthase III family protein n=1 Tax=Marinicella sp. W31 TaxID=3023713 RepID=UPI003756FFA3